jgi:hypothetical protein
MRRREFIGIFFRDRLCLAVLRVCTAEVADDWVVRLRLVNRRENGFLLSLSGCANSGVSPLLALTGRESRGD